MLYLYDYFVRNFEKDFGVYGVQELFYQLHTDSLKYIHTTEEEIRKWKFYTIEEFVRVCPANDYDYDRIISRILFYPIDESYKICKYNVVAVSKPYKKTMYDCIDGFLVYEGDLSSYKFSNYKNKKEYKKIKQKLNRSYNLNIKFNNRSIK